MKKLISGIAAAVAVAIVVPRLAAAPADPVYSTDFERLLWFLVISDDHITARDSDGAARLGWVLGECRATVQPDLILNLGDLTDASKGEPLVSVYPGPQEDEWTQYRQIVDDSGVTVDDYVDLAGNHDQYDDKGLPHYLQYSLSGSTWGRTQHSVVLTKPWGSYHFLGMNTPGNDGAGWPFDNAGLDTEELAYNLMALQQNAGARLTFAFGHHPIVRPDLGFKLSEGSDEIQRMLGDFTVRAYFYGHTHEYRDLYWPDNELMPVTLHENVASLGKSDDSYILLCAVDNDNLAIRPMKVGEFPWVLITTPSDLNQGGGNPWVYDVPTGMERAPVRALAFTTDPFLTCEYRVDGGPWARMASVGNHTYQGYMDTRGMPTGRHELEVRALPGPAGGPKITFNVKAWPCGDGIDQDSDGLTDFPTDPGCDSATDSDEYNDPVVPEPVPDIIETPDVSGSDNGPAADATDIAMPDSIDAGSDSGIEESFTEAGPDTAVNDSAANMDNGSSGDADRPDSAVTTDGSTNVDDSVNDRGTMNDSGSDESGNTTNNSSGGCSAGPDATPATGTIVILMGMLFAFAFAATIRRRSRT